MAKLYNLTRMTTATTGTGTITLGAAVSGYLTFAQAGVASGDIVDYAIKDGNNSEIGTGTYTSSGTTLTRTVTKSTNSNAAINLSGTAEVFITPRAETLADASFLTAGTLDPARVGARALPQSKLNLSGVNNTGVANLDNVLTAGFYANTGYQNSPDGASATANYWFVLVQEWDGASFTNQIACPLTGGTNDLWIRSQQGGTWSAWAKANTGNASELNSGSVPVARLSLLPFTKEFVATGQSIAASALLTLAHGLGVKPRLYFPFITCITANAGFSVGDEVALNPAGAGQDTAAAGWGMSIWADNTDIKVRFGSVPNVFLINTNPTGGSGPITPTAWQFGVRAYA